jgi:tetratricopeptide (TPR) repeat protein
VNLQKEAMLWYDDFEVSLDDPRKSAEAGRRYLELSRQSVSMDPKNVSARFSVAIAEGRVADSTRLFDPATAVALARQSVADLEALHAAAPGYLTQSRLPRMRRVLAEALGAAGNKGAAVAESDRAVSDLRQSVEQQPDDAGGRFNLVMCLYTAGRAHHAAGDVSGARGLLREAERLLQLEIDKVPTSAVFEKTRRKLVAALAEVGGLRPMRDFHNSRE